jgi:hypothetical protein
MASNLEFIKSQSANNVTSLIVSNMFSDKYEVYEVFVSGNGSQNVSSLSAEFLDSSDNDIGQGNYHTAIYRLRVTHAFDPVRTQGANSFEYAYPSSTDNDFASKFTIYNPFSSSAFTYATIQSASIYGEKNAIACKVTTSATGMKFSANQHYTPIRVSVYGVK